ncbi:MAG: 16S rRNA (guanine(966)-N(2))-methyltransferase [uncultured Sphingomonadaceae bacterium]|uniref:16S rRNA (Guanine(966)-N(2))-methyltransferase n=1 Tax=uncultured Sphingomonadaceae bacterium TaxID=169976 RepID=A0A6J4U3C1_9SPHN|nr:MAG: 16S rRNA (guanine(966)-N(2))-methyltransferase [uncultured Sphingomonadaceae bacterium]
MRIIAGAWRGRAIVAPEGADTRPTSNRAREALFSMLVSRIGDFEGLRVADLFAGSGSLGLEALSRGAAHCTFVESDRAALDAIKANVAKLGANAQVQAGTAENFHGGPFDLVFVDPPYLSGLGHKALAKITVAPGGWASIETARTEDVAVDGYEVDTERKYGKAKITLLRKL